MAKLLLQWILHRPGDKIGYMWCPHARLDTENELPRAKPIPLEQYLQLAESSSREHRPRRAGMPKMAKMGSKSKIFKLFQTVPNDPQWPPNGLKWPQNAFLGDLGPFGGHFGRFPPHFGGSPPGAGCAVRSPGSGRQAPPWNPYLSCVAIAKTWRLGAP